MTRRPFAIALAALTAGFLAAWNAAEAALPALARLLNPHGVNAGLALNGILLALLATFLTVLLILLRQRLQDAAASRWIGAVVVIGLLAWAILADWVFLWSHRVPLAAAALWGCKAAVAAGVLFALAAPSAGPERR